jgi:DNA-binding transcriptional ArsR family regulator
MLTVDLKKVGAILVVFSIVLFIVLYFITNLIISLRLDLHKTCPLPPESCPYKGSVPTEVLAAFVIDAAMGVLGVSLLITSYRSEKVNVKEKTKVKESLKSLQDDERKVYDLIINAEGFMFQNDLIEKTGYSKVKVSRILDKLEMKGIVERRRRGMANIVVLKEI